MILQHTELETHTTLIKHCENIERRNDIKSLVWYDERMFIHMYFVLAPFVILQISHNSLLLPAVHGRLQGWEERIRILHKSPEIKI
jgi:hypothetical protein